MNVKKAIVKLMKKNSFTLIRTNKHNVWQHKPTGKKVTTSASPSCQFVIRNIMKDIKTTNGVCFA